MVYCPQRTKFQHLDRKAGNRSHSGNVNVVRALPPLPEPPTQFVFYSGTWKSAHFKKYNFEAEGIYPNGGALHPLLKVREEMRNIFLEMGLVFTSFATYCLIDQSLSPPGLPRCQPPRSSSLVSGVSMRSLYHNNIRLATCRTHFTSQIRSSHCPRRGTTTSESPEYTSTAVMARSDTGLHGPTPSHTSSSFAPIRPHPQHTCCTSLQHGVAVKHRRMAKSATLG